MSLVFNSRYFAASASFLLIHNYLSIHIHYILSTNNFELSILLSYAIVYESHQVGLEFLDRLPKQRTVHQLM